MTDSIQKRDTIESLFQKKVRLISLMQKFEKTRSEIDGVFEEVNSYSPFVIDRRFEQFEKNKEEKYVDRSIWNYLVNLFHLEKYMLCTDYDKLLKEIQDFKTPDFTIENATGWINNLKDLIYDNVKTLVKSVYKRITEEVYYTGSGYNNTKKKKRNNAGVDKRFILTTYDHNRIFGWNYKPTITDDLEKACYLLDGKTLPEITIIQQMRQNKSNEAENKYFKIKVCQNENTHYTLEDAARDRLNLCGPDGASFGENIKIKVFEKSYNF